MIFTRTVLYEVCLSVKSTVEHSHQLSLQICKLLLKIIKWTLEVLFLSMSQANFQGQYFRHLASCEIHEDNFPVKEKNSLIR